MSGISGQMKKKNTTEMERSMQKVERDQEKKRIIEKKEILKKAAVLKKKP